MPPPRLADRPVRTTSSRAPLARGLGARPRVQVGLITQPPASGVPPQDFRADTSTTAWPRRDVQAIAVRAISIDCTSALPEDCRVPDPAHAVRPTGRLHRGSPRR